jgi:hypothetical protein
MANTLSEPPNPGSRPSRYLIGQDSHGRWVARDDRGLCGGLFVNQREAVRYALLETGNHREDVIMVSGPIELF